MTLPDRTYHAWAQYWTLQMSFHLAAMLAFPKGVSNASSHRSWWYKYQDDVICEIFTDSIPVLGGAESCRLRRGSVLSSQRPLKDEDWKTWKYILDDRILSSLPPTSYFSLSGWNPSHRGPRRVGAERIGSSRYQDGGRAAQFCGEAREQSFQNTVKTWEPNIPILQFCLDPTLKTMIFGN